MIRSTAPLDIPPLISNVVLLDMPDDEKEVMKRIVRECVLLYEELEKKRADQKVSFSDILSYFMKIRLASISTQLVDMQIENPEDEARKEEDDESAPLNEEDARHVARAAAIMQAPSLKIKATLALMKQRVKEGHKVIVCCTFMDPLYALQAMYGDGAAMFNGKLSENQQKETLESFEKKASAEVLLVTTMSGGTGLNLQMASAAIHMDRWWNPSLTEQATGRIWRTGQKKTCYVDHMHYKNSFDDTCTDLYNKWKAENAQKLFEDAGDEEFVSVQFDKSTAKKLLEELAKRLGLADDDGNQPKPQPQSNIRKAGGNASIQARLAKIARPNEAAAPPVVTAPAASGSAGASGSGAAGQWLPFPRAPPPPQRAPVQSGRPNPDIARIKREHDARVKSEQRRRQNERHNVIATVNLVESDFD